MHETASEKTQSVCYKIRKISEYVLRWRSERTYTAAAVRAIASTKERCLFQWEALPVLPVSRGFHRFLTYAAEQTDVACHVLGIPFRSRLGADHARSFAYCTKFCG